jgi:hypothetical protein
MRFGFNQIPGGIEEKRKHYYLLEDVFTDCHNKAKNVIETLYKVSSLFRKILSSTQNVCNNVKRTIKRAL